MRPRLLLSALAFCALPGCKHDADTAPACYSGTVVGSSCTDGLLIDVDAAQPIGGATHSYGGAFLGRNVVAVAYSPAISALSLATGQRLYFTYANAAGQPSGAVCLAYDPVRPAVPHVVLTSASATPCTAP